MKIIISLMLLIMCSSAVTYHNSEMIRVKEEASLPCKGTLKFSHSEKRNISAEGDVHTYERGIYVCTPNDIKTTGE